MPPVMLVPNAGREHSTGIGQPTGSHAAALREPTVPQGSCSAPGTLASNEGFEDYGTYEGQPSANKPYVCSYRHAESYYNYLLLKVKCAVPWSEIMAS